MDLPHTTWGKSQLPMIPEPKNLDLGPCVAITVAQGSRLKDSSCVSNEAANPPDSFC
jgi:hypothetical protein